MAKIKTQGRDRPWLPDDRSNDEILKEFASAPPPTVGRQLMRAWHDTAEGVRWKMGAIATAQQREAEKTTDVRMSRWMLDIGRRIATPLGRDAKAGELTREQLLDAAYDRVVAAGNDTQTLSAERDALRNESLRRAVEPWRRLIGEFNKEVATLAVSDVPSAGYLRGVVSELQKLAGADDADSLVAHEVIAKERKRKPRETELRPLILAARARSVDTSSWVAAWAEMLKMAAGSNPPPPIISGANGEILWGDPASDQNPKPLTKDLFRKRFKRLLPGGER